VTWLVRSRACSRRVSVIGSAWAGLATPAAAGPWLRRVHVNYGMFPRRSRPAHPACPSSAASAARSHPRGAARRLEIPDRGPWAPTTSKEYPPVATGFLNAARPRATRSAMVRPYARAGLRPGAVVRRGRAAAHPSILRTPLPDHQLVMGGVPAATQVYRAGRKAALSDSSMPRVFLRPLVPPSLRSG